MYPAPEKFFRKIFEKYFTFPKGCAIIVSEPSERHSHRGIKMKKVYEVCTLDGTVEYETEAALLKDYEKRETLANNTHRVELQGAPLLAGLFGPVFGGRDRIRYESRELYLSLCE